MWNITNHYRLTPIILALFFLSTFNVFSQENQNLTFSIQKNEGQKIKLDGILDEKIWSTADEVKLLYETDPGNNNPAEVNTICRLAFDEEYLYFSFEAFDPNPQSIRAIINDRDKLDDNDFVSLFLNPFNDSRRAFFFSVNPLGVQQDGVYDEQEGDGDLSWDGIWRSAGVINTHGYIVEAAIPFKSLRFPDSDQIQTWRFFGMRSYPRSLKKSFHSMFIDQDNNCLLCQANLMAGIRGVNPGTNLEFTPTLTLNRVDEREEFPEGGLQKGDIKTNLGLDARWGITTDLTLNVALNPDFSQVEADAAQLDVNNQFAVRFPEKRPFFLEGADFFNTPLQAFFSRTIVNPSYGAKLSGKIQKNAIGLLVARDRVNNMLLPGFQSNSFALVEEDVTNIIARYRRDVGKNSAVGLMYTGREADNYYNRVGGVDAFIRPWKPLTIRFQYLHTETQYDSSIADEHNQPQSNFGGNSLNFQSSFETRNWESVFIFESRSSGFRGDAGFVPQVDYRRLRFYVERVFWPKKKTWYANIGWNAGGFSRTNLNGGTLDQRGFWTSAFINGPLQLNYWINPDIVWRQAGGKTFRLIRLWTGFDIQPIGNWGINGFFNLGPAVDFENSRKADNIQFRLESDIRVGRHIDMTVNHRFLKLHLNRTPIVTANLSQIQAAYNFNAQTFFRVILQYRHTLRNPELYDDQTVNQVDESIFAQILLSYKLNPQSVIFLGYVDNHNGWKNDSYFEEIHLTQLNQTLFFKVGYAWRP